MSAHVLATVCGVPHPFRDVTCALPRGHDSFHAERDGLRFGFPGEDPVRPGEPRCCIRFSEFHSEDVVKTCDLRPRHDGPHFALERKKPKACGVGHPDGVHICELAPGHPSPHRHPDFGWWLDAAFAEKARQAETEAVLRESSAEWARDERRRLAATIAAGSWSAVPFTPSAIAAQSLAVVDEILRRTP